MYSIDEINTILNTIEKISNSDNNIILDNNSNEKNNHIEIIDENGNILDKQKYLKEKLNFFSIEYKNNEDENINNESNYLLVIISFYLKYKDNYKMIIDRYNDEIYLYFKDDINYIFIYFNNKRNVRMLSKKIFKNKIEEYLDNMDISKYFILTSNSIFINKKEDKLEEIEIKNKIDYNNKVKKEKKKKDKENNITKQIKKEDGLKEIKKIKEKKIDKDNNIKEIKKDGKQKKKSNNITNMDDDFLKNIKFF